ncbi:hypothetical protein D8780_03355 [Notoacmeibacter ruber]|uniref:Uncharacterized protein n=1 Tax=Notoacmeibacter ruber TaxID=2670375 RepID=A0A3L7J9G9_9HYPH|nr:hypothetical protein D8780_03355 [Notoacmeibacter ruber]
MAPSPPLVRKARKLAGYAATNKGVTATLTIGVTEAAFYRSKSMPGWLSKNKRLKEIEDQNGKLKRLGVHL